MFPDINRSAIILKPKKPFFDWIKSHDPSVPVEDLSPYDTDIILIPDFDDERDAENWLSKNYDLLFTNELYSWYIDDRMWVKNRSFEMFKQWFSYSIHLLVLDLSDDELGHFE
jgi:hypothetical protein